jgi:hypothetical protein
MLTGIIEECSDNIYLDVILNHVNTNVTLFFTDPVPPYTPFLTTITNGTPTEAKYSTSKTIPIVGNPADYYLSIIRFVIPLDSLPLFIMPVNMAQSVPRDPNQTPMILGIEYNGHKYYEYIQYFADNPLNPPSQDSSPTQVVTPYYYVYSYQNLINSINFSLMSVCNLVHAADATFPITFYPYFDYNPVTQLISLIVPKYYITGITVGPSVITPLLYINEQLRNFLEAFEFSFVGYNQADGKDYVFNLQIQYPWLTIVPNLMKNGFNLLEAAITPTPPDYYKFTQEYNVLSYWSSLRKLVVLTTSLPIQKEYVPVQNPNGTQSGITNSIPIITDFVPSVDDAGSGRQIALYNPTSQYRLVDLKSNTPIYAIDISLAWQDKAGNIYPLNISVFQQASLKLAFVKKSLYRSSTLIH